MKRLIALVLAAAMVLCGCSGTAAATRSGEIVNFYYAVQNADQLSSHEAIQPEQRSLSGFNLAQLLNLYLSGPTADNLMSPFPEGTSVLNIREDSEQVTLILSGEYFTLSGVDLTLANCCLSKTISEFSGVDQIYVEDDLGQIRLALLPEQYLISDDFDTENESNYTLYFPSQDRSCLLAEVRSAALSENETQEAYVIRQLTEGPNNGEAQPLIPDGTRLLDVSTQDGLCTVNLSGEFCNNRFDDGLGAFTTIFGIVNSLTALKNVEAVEFLIDGEPRIHYGMVMINEPIHSFSGIIGTPQKYAGSVKVGIYVRPLDSTEMLAIPTRVDSAGSKPQAEAVVETILEYEPPQGFENPVGYGTEVYAASVSGGICYVDLSRKFIPQEDTRENEEAAVLAIVSPLMELDGVTGVVLTIEGESSGLQYVDINRTLHEKNILSD